MRVDIRNKTVCVTGRIRGLLRTEVQEKLRGFGCTLSRAPGESVDIVLAGSGAAWKMLKQAKALNIPVIEGESALQILQQGETEYIEEQGDANIHDVLGDLRELLANQDWGNLTKKLDECSPEALPEILSYVRQHVDGWSPQPEFSWNFPYAGHEIRVLPYEWLLSILGGNKDEKFALARGVSLGTTRLPGKQLAKFFKTDQLPHLRVISLLGYHGHNELKRPFFEAMAKAKNLQNVDTLYATGDSAAALTPLLEATSLPSLRHLFVQELRESSLELVRGPWQEQLLTLGLFGPYSPTSLEMMELKFPSLQHICLNPALSRVSGELDIAEWASEIYAIEALLATIPELTLIAESKTLQHLLLELAQQSLTSLKTLRLWGGSSMSGSAGVHFMKTFLVESGLADKIETIILDTHYDAQVCQYLASLGLEVQTPGRTGVLEEKTMASFILHPIAEGDSLRREQGLVDLTDAMQFDTPSKEAWRVVLAVADGLATQLMDTPDAYQKTIDELDAYLQTWPDQVRTCPFHWQPLYLTEKGDPRLQLVRSLKINGYHWSRQAKIKSQILLQMAKSPYVHHINFLTFWYLGKQKSLLKGFGELVKASSPKSISITDYNGQEKFNYLNQQQIPYVEKRTHYVPPAPPEYTDGTGLEQRYVHLKITQKDEFIKILQRTDLEHVISLKLVIHKGDWESFELNFPYIPANWSHLQYVRLEIWPSRYDDPITPPIVEALTHWLANARPLVVDHTAAMGAIKKGLLKRAYGAKLYIPQYTDPEEIREVLSNGNIRVSAIEFSGGYPRSVADCLPWLDTMHPILKKSIQGLRWPLAREEYPHANEILSHFPRLTIWQPLTLDLPEEADSLIEHISQSPTSQQLGMFSPIMDSRGQLEMSKTLPHHQKMLNKGKGIKSYHYLLYGNMTVPQPFQFYD